MSPRQIQDEVHGAVIGGKRRLSEIAASVIQPERVVDRALQVLRKAGVISYTHADGWIPSPSAVPGEKP